MRGRTLQSANSGSYRLTSRARDLLDFIGAYIEAHRVAPSYREMADGLGLVSVGRIGEMLDQLEQRGHIRRLHDETVTGRVRAIELTDAQTFRLPADLAARLCAEAKISGLLPEQHLADAVRAFLASP